MVNTWQEGGGGEPSHKGADSQVLLGSEVEAFSQPLTPGSFHRNARPIVLALPATSSVSATGSPTRVTSVGVPVLLIFELLYTVPWSQLSRPDDALRRPFSEHLHLGGARSALQEWLAHAVRKAVSSSTASACPHAHSVPEPLKFGFLTSLLPSSPKAGMRHRSSFFVTSDFPTLGATVLFAWVKGSGFQQQGPTGKQES